MVLVTQIAPGWPVHSRSSRMTRTEWAVHTGPAARGLTVMVEGRSQNQRSLQNMNKSQLARPCTGQENAWGVLHATPTENARAYHT